MTDESNLDEEGVAAFAYAVQVGAAGAGDGDQDFAAAVGAGFAADEAEQDLGQEAAHAFLDLRDGTLAGFVIGLVVIFLYYALLEWGRSLGMAGIVPVWVAAWLPNLVARLLTRQGADVAFSYRGNEAAATATVGEIEALGRKGLAVQADVSDAGAAEGLDHLADLLQRVVDTFA